MITGRCVLNNFRRINPGYKANGKHPKTKKTNPNLLRVGIDLFVVIIFLDRAFQSMTCNLAGYFFEDKLANVYADQPCA